MVDLTTRTDLPIPMDEPVTGEELLQVINESLDPILQSLAHLAFGRIMALAPLAVAYRTPHGPRTVPGYLVQTGYTPKVGDIVVILGNAEHAVVLGAAPAGG